MNLPTSLPRLAQQPPLFLRLSAALLLVALATGAGLLVAQHWGAGPVVLLYILPVLAAGVWGGPRPAVVAAVASALAYNFYFTAPYRSLLIHNPVDIVTVAVLFAVHL